MKTSRRDPRSPKHLVSRLPVHSHTTIAGDGERESKHRVYCEVRDATVDVDVCAHCHRAREIPKRPTDPNAAVACITGKAPAHELLDVPGRAHLLPIAQIMRRSSVSVTADASLETVERVVLEGDNDAVVVVDADHTPVGMITKTDLLWRLYDESDTSEPEPSAPPERGLHVVAPTVTAGDVMTPVVHALPDDATLSIGVSLLAIGDVEQAPVVSKENRVVGLFSNADVVRWLAAELGIVTPR